MSTDSTDMGAWAKDDEIMDAWQGMLHAFMDMYEDDQQNGVLYEALTLSKHHLEWMFALDPQKMSDEYILMYEAAQAIGGSEGAEGRYGTALAEIRISGDHLDAWTGDAADAFKKQLSMMEQFCKSQSDRTFNAIGGVAAAYAAAVEARANYVAVLVAATDAARNVIAGQQAKETQMKLTIIADLAQSVLSLAPQQVAATVAGTLIDLTKDTVPLLMDDSGRDQVARSYVREARRVCYDLRDACEGIERQFRIYRDSAINDDPGMFEPLPSYCDVTGPDFSYDKFKDNVHDPGPIGPEVEAERQKYAKEKPVPDQDMDKRLNPQ